jgi:small subunit ribosomal protein S17
MSAAEEQTQDRRPTTTKQGYVVSDKRDKTRTVRVSYQARHRKYGKYLQRQSNYQVHDPQNATRNGDLVEIALCRPISKRKSWRLVRVIEAAPPPVEHKRQQAQQAGTENQAAEASA